VIFSEEDKRVYAACSKIDYFGEASFEDLLQGCMETVTDDYNEEDGVIRDTVRRETWKIHLRLGNVISVFSLGTLFFLNGEETLGSYFLRKPCSLKHRKAGFTVDHVQFYCAKADGTQQTIEEYLLANWYPTRQGTSLSGVPWEITTILDRDARVAALRGYWKA